ncbi:hypothetical protein [Enterococcus mundtii]|uniref:hypothetical protein n=1 Tax=Enterococcus mundtii TaxID=53346 RepID=UPI001896C909|nr:hypothetical protein [Enterococcus mundtii]
MEKEQQVSVLESLQRSKEFCSIENSQNLKKLLENMRNNDPTDFMIFPIPIKNPISEYMQPQLNTLTIYKKEDYFVVTQVENGQQDEPRQLEYFWIPLMDVASLCEVISFSRNTIESIDSVVPNIVDEIREISDQYEVTPTPIDKKETIAFNDHWIGKVESALRIILSNCRTNEFYISSTIQPLPPWNMKHPDPNIEMKKRFLEAVKGQKQEWNDQFDYVFDYFLYKKNRLIENSVVATESFYTPWPNIVEFLFVEDPYIVALRKSNGDISRAVSRELSYLRNRMEMSVVDVLDALDQLGGGEVIDLPFSELENGFHKNGEIISVYKERLPLIRLPIAKEMTQLCLSKMEVRSQEIEGELKRRRTIRRKLDESSRITQFVSKVVPTSLMDYITPNQEAMEQRQEFAKRVDMLAMSLSLKPNDQSFVSPESYELLFSIYAKMIRTDYNNFFVDRIQTMNIVHSLKRTIQLYRMDGAESLQTIFEKLKNYDPTDFMLIPVAFSTDHTQKYFGHVCGLTIYKRENNFVVLKVDKEQSYRTGSVSYVKVPFEKARALSQLLFSERHFSNEKPYDILKKIEGLSHEFRQIPAIQLKEQTIDNSVISEIEASLRTILFNCKKDIFHLNDQERVTPKWGKLDEPMLARPQRRQNWWMEDLGTTVTMKERFLLAVKGMNGNWNKNLQYIYDYYFYFKNICKKMEHSGIDQKQALLKNIRYLFQHDPYIQEMVNRRGEIPTIFDEQLRKKVKEMVESMGSLPDSVLRIMETSKIQQEIQINAYVQGFIKQRLPFIKIPVAKEMSEHMIYYTEMKNDRLQREYQRRVDLAQKKQKEEPIYRSTTMSITETSSPVAHSSRASLNLVTRSTNLGDTLKGRFSELCDRAKNLSGSVSNNLVREATNKTNHRQEK